MLGAVTQHTARSQFQNWSAVNLFVGELQVGPWLHCLIRLSAGVNQNIIIREGRPIEQVKALFTILRYARIMF